ncbi:MAG: hypothetical protein LBM78_00520, partial [Clostridiales bacterium]|nr:hypothetical protein [Clostridiales bacterium]
IEDTAGLFAPAWTFDADTYSVYRGVVGDYYYVTVGSGKNQRRERRIRYRPVHGTYAQFFDDVVVHASGTLDKKRLQKIGPYPTKDATTYKPEYIAGYSAEKYQLGLAPGWAQAKNGIDATIRSRIIASLHCDVVQSLSITTDYRDKKFKYILLPLFLFKHKFKEKLYQVYLNACTRKIAGEYPKSAGKILALVFSIVGAVALAVLIGWLVTR